MYAFMYANMTDVLSLFTQTNTQGISYIVMHILRFTLVNPWIYAYVNDSPDNRHISLRTDIGITVI